MASSLPLLLAGAALLAGCAPVVPHLAPTPAVIKDPRLDFARNLQPALRTTQLPVFFATTRKAVDGPEHFGNGQADGVTLGVATVRLGEPGWTWDQLLASDLASSVAQPRPGEVELVQVMGTAGRGDAFTQADRDFIANIDAQLARTSNRSVVLYVHGYRVTFDEVAVQMGSFAHYLGQGATVTFQWPTGTKFWNYVTDCPKARQFIPDIARLVALLAQTQARQVNLLAYSCGSPLLASALAQLRAQHAGLDHEALQQRLRIGNVIFAASDVDLKTFAREHVKPALDLAQQVVVYFSRADRALGFSSLIAGASRLGSPELEDLEELSLDELRVMSEEPRFQAIDVTDVRGAHEMGGMKGHGYWYANEVISTDVTLSLRYPIPPERRCLRTKPGTKVWRMPEDYVECVGSRLLEAYPALRR
ncbi:alpha/beta hydrolase [Ramlibacter sp. USB13]|uniref:Alpha/beta hydrolase n=1 Tax=Ramlibacter cellulosilyticus TaxID=2764187 RepID=A0A923MUX3_9BURK|nr:alpha/beta hydrolase [Ramlibacter cellulosilyticus]MBC5785625.1 alpha/beta hydrolase [Ramlibacter cellulosilyticus]